MEDEAEQRLGQEGSQVQQEEAASEGAAGEPDGGGAPLESDAGEPAAGREKHHWRVLQENLLVEKHSWRVCRQLWHRRDVRHMYRWDIEGVEVSHPVSVTTDNRPW